MLALALAAHLQSLTFQTLGVILISHMRCRARIADGKARAQAALGHAALRTFGDGSSSTGHRLPTCGDGSYARVLFPAQATGLAAPPSHRPASWDNWAHDWSVLVSRTSALRDKHCKRRDAPLDTHCKHALLTSIESSWFLAKSLTG